MDLRFSVQTRIQKPVTDVFDGVYNPSKLSAYFTTGSASGPLEAGAIVVWQFADFPGEIPVEVKEVIPNELIVFTWKNRGENDITVRMEFIPIDADQTLVRISETGWRGEQKDLDESYSHCQGWMQMSCCLKAYLEYGINLRQGAFHIDDFRESFESS